MNTHSTPSTTSLQHNLIPVIPRLVPTIKTTIKINDFTKSLRVRSLYVPPPIYIYIYVATANPVINDEWNINAQYFLNVSHLVAYMWGRRAFVTRALSLENFLNLTITPIRSFAITFTYCFDMQQVED